MQVFIYNLSESFEIGDVFVDDPSFAERISLVSVSIILSVPFQSTNVKKQIYNFMMLDLKGTQLKRIGHAMLKVCLENLGIWEFTMYVMQYNKSKSGNIMWKQV